MKEWLERMVVQELRVSVLSSRSIFLEVVSYAHQDHPANQDSMVLQASQASRELLELVDRPAWMAIWVRQEFQEIQALKDFRASTAAMGQMACLDLHTTRELLDSPESLDGVVNLDYLAMPAAQECLEPAGFLAHLEFLVTQVMTAIRVNKA